MLKVGVVLEFCYTTPMEHIAIWLGEKGLAVLIVIGVSLVIYYLGAKLIKSLIRQAVKSRLRKASKMDMEKRRKTLTSLVLNIWRVLIVAIVAVSLLEVFFPQIDLTPLFASAGIIGVAIAFGSQSLVKDFITGIFIISENQYRLGDYVDINDANGRVEQVGMRSTVIRDENGNVHYIPNGSIVHVVNKSMGYSKVYFKIALNASVDLDAAISVINQVGDELAADAAWKDKVLSAPQFQDIDTMSGSSIEVTITGKTQPSDQWAVTAEMRKRLLGAFDAADIKLA